MLDPAHLSIYMEDKGWLTLVVGKKKKLVDVADGGIGPRTKGKKKFHGCG